MRYEYFLNLRAHVKLESVLYTAVNIKHAVERIWIIIFNFLCPQGRPTSP